MHLILKMAPTMIHFLQVSSVTAVAHKNKASLGECQGPFTFVPTNSGGAAVPKPHESLPLLGGTGKLPVALSPAAQVMSGPRGPPV